MTGGLGCSTATPCTMSANASAGFNITAPRGAGEAAAMMTANGNLAMMMVFPNQGGLVVATRRKAATLPAVGEAGVFEPRWTLDLASANDGTLSRERTRVSAVDSTAKTFTRQRADLATTTFHAEDPAQGLLTLTAGSSDEVLSLPLNGAGLSVYRSAGNKFGIAIERR
jgi:hypothetical protein